MTAVLEGVRVLEVADHTFVPAASALLSDWGAEVIKVEHVERGDAMRGLATTGLAVVSSNVHVLLEHANRGKRSIALDLATPEGGDILHRLAATCDVFVTNKLPRVRAKLRLEVDDLRATNPDIVYVCGSGQGRHGPDAARGSFDALSFWSRSGIALGTKQPDDDHLPPPPAPAFGDSVSALAIAAGVMGALLHRERTGEAPTVDVSLLGTALWTIGSTLALSLQLGKAWEPVPRGDSTGNPLVASYRTLDGRYVVLSCLQAARFWGELCRVLELPGLASDPRFADAGGLVANAAAATDILRGVFAGRTADDWRDRLAGFSGPWAMAQDTLEAAADPQARANGYLVECEAADGTTFELAAAPVQFDDTPATPRRAPGFNEHGDAILADLGFDADAIVDLKVRGIVA